MEEHRASLHDRLQTKYSSGSWLARHFNYHVRQPIEIKNVNKNNKIKLNKLTLLYKVSKN